MNVTPIKVFLACSEYLFCKSQVELSLIEWYVFATPEAVQRIAHPDRELFLGSRLLLGHLRIGF